MKTFLLTLFVLASVSTAHAFDLGGLESGAKDLECADQALKLVKAGGHDVLTAYTKYSATNTLSAADLGLAAGTYNSLQSYVDSGCAKSHLEKALSQL